MTLHFLCHKLVFLISPAPDSSSHQLGYPLLSPSSLGRKPTDHCASVRAGGPHLRYWMTHLGPASLPSALSHAQGLRLGLRPTAPWHSLSPTSATAHMQWMHSLQLQTLHALAEVWDPTPQVLCEAHFMSITMCLCNGDGPRGHGYAGPASGPGRSCSSMRPALAPVHLSTCCPTVRASSASWSVTLQGGSRAAQSSRDIVLTSRERGELLKAASQERGSLFLRNPSSSPKG